MSTLNSILNKKACGGAIGVNTGKRGCLSLFGTPTHVLLIQKGFEIPVTQDLTLEYLSDLIQRGVIIPIIDSSNFEDLSADDSYSTNSSGVKRLNLEGLIELKFMYEEGHEFYRQIDKLKSFKSYDLILIDDESNWMLVTVSNGSTKGFSLGHVTPDRRTLKVKGGDEEMKSLSLQLLDRSQWDQNYAIAHAEELTFTAEEIPTINGVNLNFVEIPQAAATTLKIEAVLSSDGNSPVEGLDLSNFLYLVGGESIEPTGVVETSTGVYELTVPALTLAAELEVSLYDTAKKLYVAVDSGGLLFRSNTASESVIA